MPPAPENFKIVPMTTNFKTGTSWIHFKCLLQDAKIPSDNLAQYNLTYQGMADLVEWRLNDEKIFNHTKSSKIHAIGTGPKVKDFSESNPMYRVILNTFLEIDLSDRWDSRGEVMIGCGLNSSLMSLFPMQVFFHRSQQRSITYNKSGFFLQNVESNPTSVPLDLTKPRKPTQSTEYSSSTEGTKSADSTVPTESDHFNRSTGRSERASSSTTSEFPLISISSPSIFLLIHLKTKFHISSISHLWNDKSWFHFSTSLVLDWLEVRSVRILIFHYAK